PQCVHRYCCLAIRIDRLSRRAQPLDEPPLLGIFQLLGAVREVGDKGLELEPVYRSVEPEVDLVFAQLGIDRLALFPGREEGERDAPAQLGATLGFGHRASDVVGVDGILASQMPDLQAQRVAPDTRLDPPIDADPAPGPADERLPRLPLL